MTMIQRQRQRKSRTREVEYPTGDGKPMAETPIHVSNLMESFQALDDPDRNLLVLFKLHPLAGGKVRNGGGENLRIALPGDQIAIPIE